MTDYSSDLSLARLQRSVQTLRVAEDLIKSNHYADSINRSYYSAFHAVNAVHALVGQGYKRHKDAIANFNKLYVATGLMPRSIGKDLSTLEVARNVSDYDDFRITSKSEADINYQKALHVVKAVCEYCSSKGLDMFSVEAAYYLDANVLTDFLDSTPKSIIGAYTVKELIDLYLSTIK